MKQLPIIIEKIDFDGDRKKLYDELVSQHLQFRYTPNTDPLLDSGLSFPAKDNANKDLARLYNRMLQKAYKYFPELVLSTENSTQCWVYCISKDDRRAAPCITPHDHIKTSSINTVYYLCKSDEGDERDGAIAFFEPQPNNMVREIGFYKPKQDEIILMPNWLMHSPLITQSKEYRVSINMEIKAEKF